MRFYQKHKQGWRPPKRHIVRWCKFISAFVFMTVLPMFHVPYLGLSGRPASKRIQLVSCLQSVSGSKNRVDFSNLSTESSSPYLCWTNSLWLWFLVVLFQKDRPKPSGGSVKRHLALLSLRLEVSSWVVLRPRREARLFMVDFLETPGICLRQDIRKIVQKTSQVMMVFMGVYGKKHLK